LIGRCRRAGLTGADPGIWHKEVRTTDAHRAWTAHEKCFPAWHAPIMHRGGSSSAPPWAQGGAHTDAHRAWAAHENALPPAMRQSCTWADHRPPLHGHKEVRTTDAHRAWAAHEKCFPAWHAPIMHRGGSSSAPPWAQGGAHTDAHRAWTAHENALPPAMRQSCTWADHRPPLHGLPTMRTWMKQGLCSRRMPREEACPAIYNLSGISRVPRESRRGRHRWRRA
jgi:hypothetical protein